MDGRGRGKGAWGRRAKRAWKWPCIAQFNKAAGKKGGKKEMDAQAAGQWEERRQIAAIQCRIERTAESHRAGLVGGRGGRHQCQVMKSRKQDSLYFSDMHLKAYGGSSMSEDCREEGLQPIVRFPNPHPIPSLVHVFPEICLQVCPLLSLTSSGPLTLAPCCSSTSKATQLSIALMKRGQVPKHSEALINPSYLATLVPVP